MPGLKLGSLRRSPNTSQDGRSAEEVGLPCSGSRILVLRECTLCILVVLCYSSLLKNLRCNTALVLIGKSPFCLVWIFHVKDENEKVKPPKQ